jgi:YbbR domain-containing protein
VRIRADVINTTQPDIVIEAIEFDALQAEISGPASLVSQVAAVTVPLDLSNQRSTFESDVRPIPVDIDGNIVDGVTSTPATVHTTVTLSQSETVRELNVRPQLVGELPIGYFLTSVQYSPTSVYVTVPGGSLDSLPDSLFTTAIDLSNRTDDFTVVVPVELPNRAVIPVSQSNITVTVGVDAQTGTRQFNEVRVELIGAQPNFAYQLDPGNVSVIFTAPEPLLQTLEEADVRVTVDVSTIASVGTYRLTPTVPLAQNETFSVNVLPAEITVQVRDATQATATP